MGRTSFFDLFDYYESQTRRSFVTAAAAVRLSALSILRFATDTQMLQPSTFLRNVYMSQWKRFLAPWGGQTRLTRYMMDAIQCADLFTELRTENRPRFFESTRLLALTSALPNRGVSPRFCRR